MCVVGIFWVGGVGVVAPDAALRVGSVLCGLLVVAFF